MGLGMVEGLESAKLGIVAPPTVAGAMLLEMNLAEGVDGILDTGVEPEGMSRIEFSRPKVFGSAGMGFLVLLARLATADLAEAGGGLAAPCLGVLVMLLIFAEKLETGSILVRLAFLAVTTSSGAFLTGDGVGGRLF